MLKPTIDEDTIKNQLKDYSKQETKLTWEELKADCKIVNGKVINTKTGEDLTNYVSIETKPEKIIIK